MMQTSSGKLRQRALQDDPSYEELVKMGISQEQAKKKAETLPDGEGDQITRAVQEARAVQEELRRLTGGKKGPGGGSEAAQKTKCKRCCLSRCKGKESCPAEGKQCHTCKETGHFIRSSLCTKKKVTTKKLEALGESDSGESVGRITAEVQVGKVQDEGAQGIRVTLAAAAWGKELTEARFRPLTDTGVWRTIINMKDWRKVGEGAKIRPTTLKFRPYGTRHFLPILGRAKMTLQAEAGATIDTEVYVNDSETEESLLGEMDVEWLGINQVQVRGGSKAMEVR